MSRSYKKTPYCGDTKTVGKRLANQRVRRGKYKNYDFPDGCAYKRAYEQWDVCDHWSMETWEQCKHDWLYPRWPWVRAYRDRFPTEKDLYRHWLKYYRNK